jgi:hypothetical protein
MLAEGTQSDGIWQRRDVKETIDVMSAEKRQPCMLGRLSGGNHVLSSHEACTDDPLDLNQTNDLP